jgi:hypothetical protein
MLTFLKNRILSYVGSKDIINIDYKYSSLSVDLTVDDIDFINTIYNNQNVITPTEKEKMVDKVLLLDFSK